ncbi:MAG: hypothetical protein H6Q60_1328 [Oscillospiraceae bacterium]|nr:hypothetical protein [Oscillospiraceae bacterium]
MQPVSKEYSVLFNEITDISEEVIRLYKRLVAIQQTAEEIYISQEDT